MSNGGFYRDQTNAIRYYPPYGELDVDRANHHTGILQHFVIAGFAISEAGASAAPNGVEIGPSFNHLGTGGIFLNSAAVRTEYRGEAFVASLATAPSRANGRYALTAAAVVANAPALSIAYSAMGLEYNNSVAVSSTEETPTSEFSNLLVTNADGELDMDSVELGVS